MKDRLVFKKTKTNNLNRGISDCNGCSMQGASNCGSDATCYILCEKGYNFKLVEEPDEIMSEYDHKKERYDILSSIGTSIENGAEILELEKWLKDNPKECWETINAMNVLKGETILNIHNKREKLFVQFLSRKTIDDRDILIEDIEKQTSLFGYSCDYEINTNKQGGE